MLKRNNRSINVLFPRLFQQSVAVSAIHSRRDKNINPSGGVTITANQKLETRDNKLNRS